MRNTVFIPASMFDHWGFATTSGEAPGGFTIVRYREHIEHGED